MKPLLHKLFLLLLTLCFLCSCESDYSSSLIFLILAYSILNVCRDISQNRKSKNRLKEEPEKEKIDTSPVFQDEEKRK